jgi:Type II restriction endonuclease, TdeIII
MPTEIEVKRIIKETVKSSILAFAQKQLRKRPKFQILDLIIPKERKVRSIVGGLETSLGTTLWEPLAKALASQNGFTIKAEKLESPVNIPASLSQTLQLIIDDRKRDGGTYDAASSHEAIKNACQAYIRRPINGFEKPPKGRGVDIWLVKDNVNYFFDTKTVQPNISALTACMEQVLTWYAYFYSRFPQENAESRIVFPYNPYSGNFWDKIIGKGKPLAQDHEAWVEGQFWDFCSGIDNTYNLIKAGFDELRESGELEESFRQLLG